LVPRLGPPGQGRWWVWAFLLVTAFVLLLPASLAPHEFFAGGLPDLPYRIAYHWLIEERGLEAATRDRMWMYPSSNDLTIEFGFPVDVYAARPLVATLGMPLGYTMWQILVLWAAGCSAAWLASRWWRSSAAGLVAGVSYQCAPALTLGMDEGRFNELLGAAFVPLVLGLASLSLVRRRRREALLGGACLGAVALAHWLFGLYAALAVLLLALFALIERRPIARPLSWLAIGALLVAGPVLGVVVLDRAGPEDTLVKNVSTITVGGEMLSFPERVQSHTLSLDTLRRGGLCFGPVAIVLAVLSVVRRRTRRWAAPLCWIVAFTWMATGLWLHLPGKVFLPGPFQFFDYQPIVNHYWWPDRALYLVAPAAAVMVSGGGLAWLRTARGPFFAIALAILLIAESFVLQKQLPIEAWSAEPTSDVQTLAERDTPLLLLPLPAGELRGNGIPLLEQRFHGRPMVTCVIPPLDTLSRAPCEGWFEPPVLKEAARCERLTGGDPKIEIPQAHEQLRELGLREVYLEEAALVGVREPEPLAEGDLRAYLSCIDKILGTDYRRSGSLRIYSVQDDASGARTADSNGPEDQGEP